MKIKEIRIKDFRGFPGPGEYTFILDDKNLLLYGENGSGKSTLSRALQEFLNTDGAAKDFKSHKNIFSDKSGPPLTDGHVTLVLSGNAGEKPLTWGYGGARQSGDPDVKEASLRARFLDYRSLLRTNFATASLNKQMFELAVNSLFSNIPYAPPGGQEHPLRKYWEDVKARIAEVDQAKRARRPGVKGPVKDQPRRFAAAGTAANLFSDAVKGLKPAITRETQRILDEYFRDLDITGFDLQFDGLTYNKNVNAVEGDSLGIKVNFINEEIPDHPAFLNEARLSAIALAIYVASIKLGTPPAPAGGDVLRLLVLDDVLIGLDLSNRSPVLRVLRKEFAEYQILLSTYDRWWFEVAKRELRDWVTAELYDAKRQDGCPEPVHVPQSLTNYEAAKTYFKKRDYPACANYLRKEAEEQIVRFVPEYFRRRETQRGEIGYARSLQELYDVFCRYLEKNGVPAAPYGRLALYKDIILNPFSHADLNTPVYRRELEEVFVLMDKMRALRNEIVADAGTVLSVTKANAGSPTYTYRVELKEPLRTMLSDGSVLFAKCQAKPVQVLKDGHDDKFTEHDDALKALYERYCHWFKFAKGSPYTDFVLPDGKTLEQRAAELLGNP